MGVEMIEVVERRRRWSTEDKPKVLMDAPGSGASIATVAVWHRVIAQSVLHIAATSTQRPDARRIDRHEGSAGLFASEDHERALHECFPRATGAEEKGSLPFLVSISCLR